MKADLIIYNAGQLVTCASSGEPKRMPQMQDVGIIEGGAIAIDQEKMIAIGKTADILREYESAAKIDAEGKVVTPGFVECHTHIVFAGNRFNEFELKIKGADYLEILQSGGGILSTVDQTRKADLSQLIDSSKSRLDKLLELGVTTCEVKTGYGLNTETELKMLAAIIELDRRHSIDLIPTFIPAHAFPPEFKENTDGYVELVCDEMLPKAADILKSKYNGGNFFVDVFCEKNAFDLKQARRVLVTGKSLGFKLKAHVDEFTNLGGSRMAIELGATSIDHLDAISDEEIVLLARSGTVGVITPTVNFNFGSCEFAAARKMLDAGCALAISTDYNPGSAPCPSLPNAMAIACRYQKILPAEAFNAATVNAAFAVGLGREAGSLEVGKQADILIFDSRDYREIAYEFGGNMIETVIKKGKIVKK